MSNRVGIYCRLSTEDRNKRSKEDDSESIANQKSMLLKYCLDHNYEVHNVYSDDDYSGIDKNRPEFKKMINDCKDGKIDIVLCKSQSRFSRDMEVIEKYIHNKFVLWNIRFISIVDNADTEVASNKKARQINGLINEWYLEDLSCNIRKSLQNRREDGKFLGSFAPYGYIKDPNDKNKLLIDEVAADVVRTIFKLAKEGKGYYYIANYLNERNISTPGTRKLELNSKLSVTQSNKKGALWYNQAIYNIIKNEVYTGVLVQGKSTFVSYKNKTKLNKKKEEWTKVANTHEAIIDVETWKAVHSKLTKRIRSSTKSGEVYTLSKKVYCEHCGKVFTRNLYRTKDGNTPYLKCKGRRDAAIKCENCDSIRCDEIEEVLTNEINKQLEKYYSLPELERKYLLQEKSLNNDVLKKRQTLKDELKDINTKIDKKNNNYKKLYDDKLDGIISEEEFMMLREKYLEEIDTLKKRTESINLEQEEIASSEEHLTNSIKIFEQFKKIVKMTKEFADMYVDRVWLSKKDEYGKRNMKIEFNFLRLLEE